VHVVLTGFDSLSCLLLFSQGEDETVSTNSQNNTFFHVISLLEYVGILNSFRRCEITYDSPLAQPDVSTSRVPVDTTPICRIDFLMAKCFVRLASKKSSYLLCRPDGRFPAGCLLSCMSHYSKNIFHARAIQNAARSLTGAFLASCFSKIIVK
jgi:hypothetical protein